MEDSKNDLNSVAGRRIRFLRKMMGLSQEALAAKLNFSYQQLQKYESGKNNISINTLAEICKHLNIDTVKLLEQASADMTTCNTESIIRKQPSKWTTQTLNTLDDFKVLEDSRIYNNILELLSAVAAANANRTETK